MKQELSSSRSCRVAREVFREPRGSFREIDREARAEVDQINAALTPPYPSRGSTLP
jgi:hypothetical protein